MQVGLYGADESVSAFRDGLDVDRLLGLIAEGVAQLRDGGVQSRRRIDERLRAPESSSQLRARDDLAGAFEQRREQSKRQILKRH